MDAELTAKQRKVLNLIKQFTKRNKIPPTLKELGERLGIAPPSVLQHVRLIEKKGFLKRGPLKPRCLIVTESEEPEEKRDCLDVSVIGTIAAGEPILAYECKERTICIKKDVVGRKRNLFALKVKGDSMQDAAILDGDIIIVQKQNTAENGEIVVALIDDEATVKKFCLKYNKVYLQPANENHKPIMVTSGNFQIQGKVIAVHRDFR